MKQRIRHLIYIIILVLFDQITKYWARTTLQTDGPISVIPEVFAFYYHENTGAVWGIMSGKVELLSVFTIVIMALIVYIYFKIPNNKKLNAMKLVLVFIIAGAVGNMIDRLTLKYVVDFLYFELINFPIFNIADCYITVSCFLLFALAIFYYKEEDVAFLDHLFTKKKPFVRDSEAQENIEVQENVEAQEIVDEESSK